MKKEGKNKKTVLESKDIEQIVSTFHEAKIVDDFSVTPSFEEIKEKNYSFSAGQYFDVKIEYVDITQEEFDKKMQDYQETLRKYFEEGTQLQEEIMSQLKKVKYE